MAELLRPWRLGILVALAVAAAFAFAACGDDDEEAVGGTLAVDLSEFSIVTDSVSVPRGNVTLNTDNIGDFEHELVVIRTDLSATALPLAEGGGVDESQVDVVGRIDSFEPGSASASFDLSAGNYALVCNITFVPEDGDPLSHYENGMRTVLTVTG